MLALTMSVQNIIRGRMGVMNIYVDPIHVQHLFV